MKPTPTSPSPPGRFSMSGALAAAWLVLACCACRAALAAGAPITGSETATSSPADLLTVPKEDPRREQAEVLFLKEPYLIFPGDPSRMRLLWQLDAARPCLLTWRMDGPAPNDSETERPPSGGRVLTNEYDAGHQHSALLSGLVPGRHYQYRVIADGVTRGGSFTAAPAEGFSKLKFLVYGDTRSHPAAHDTVAAAMVSLWKADPAYQTFVLVVGDLVSNGEREAAWREQFFSPAYADIRALMAGLPYQSCRGNHEGSAELFAKYFPYPVVAARYWSFDYGPAHFVMVDQYVDCRPGSPQFEWMEADLAATDRKWKFLCLHEPGWSAGSHEDNPDVQAYLQPLCVKHGVSAVFAGHNHYYARAVVEGVQHITTGGGGAPAYTPEPGRPYVVAEAQGLHFCEVEIDGGRLTLRARTPGGRVLDSFTMKPLAPRTGRR